MSDISKTCPLILQGQILFLVPGEYFFPKGSTYRKIPNVSPGLIEVFKHFLGGLIFGWGLYSGGLTFGGHFVLVSEYQDLKNHCFI